MQNFKLGMAGPKKARKVLETTGFCRAKPMPLSDDIGPYVVPFQHQTANQNNWMQNMLPAVYQSCSDMLSKWEKMVCTEGYSELDVWPYLVDLTRDVISRSAFGSSFEEGKRIFQLLEDQLV
ncbi:hypothetical protein Gotur_002361, partial [Gossypium turneri]